MAIDKVGIKLIQRYCIRKMKKDGKTKQIDKKEELRSQIL
jgi:hypothetical protein